MRLRACLKSMVFRYRAHISIFEEETNSSHGRQGRERAKLGTVGQLSRRIWSGAPKIPQCSQGVSMSPSAPSGGGGASRPSALLSLNGIWHVGLGTSYSGRRTWTDGWVGLKGWNSRGGARREETPHPNGLAETISNSFFSMRSGLKSPSKVWEHCGLPVC